MYAVQGIYADGTVTINEPVPVNKKYDVVVTFIKPTEQTEIIGSREKKIAALKRITGILSDSPMTLEEAKSARLSRQSTYPALKDEVCCFGKESDTGFNTPCIQ